MSAFRLSAAFLILVMVVLTPPARADFSGPYSLVPPAPGQFNLLAGGGAALGAWTVIPMSRAVNVDTTGAPNQLIIDAIGKCWMHATVNAVGTVSYRYAFLSLFSTNAVESWSTFSQEMRAGDLIEFTPFEGRMLIKDFNAPMAPAQFEFTLQPIDYRVAPTQAVTLSAKAASSYNLPFTYQWELNGAAIPGATMVINSDTFDYQRVTTLTVKGGAAGSTNYYRVLAKSEFGQGYSASAQVISVPSPEPRLLLHLDFEDPGAFTDSAAHLPIVISGDVRTGPGRVGRSAAEFTDTSLEPTSIYSLTNGSLRIQSASADLDLVNTGYTIAWWFRPNTNGTHAIFRLGPPGGESGYTALRAEHGAGQDLLFYLQNNLTKPQVSTALSNKGWQHCAIVYNWSTLSIYLDGVAQATIPASHGPIGTLVDDLLINPVSAWDGDSPLGALDDFRIYNYPLSQPELFALASLPLPPPQLLITAKTGALIISCSDAIGTRSRLESATSVGEEAAWSLVREFVQANNEQYVSTQSPSGSARFFRVRRIESGN